MATVGSPINSPNSGRATPVTCRNDPRQLTTHLGLISPRTTGGHNDPRGLGPAQVTRYSPVDQDNEPGTSGKRGEGEGGGGGEREREKKVGRKVMKTRVCMF